MDSGYPGIFRLRSSCGANGYVVHHGRRTAVIDPGLAQGAGRMVRELRDAEVLGSVTDILLTHHDLDHSGAAARLQEATGAVVRIGAADAEVLAGRRPAGTAYRRLLARLPAEKLRGRVEAITGEDEVFPGVRAIQTPGHTDGHVAFLAGEVLFAGDAVWATGCARQCGVAFHQYPGLITNDRGAARRSEQILRGLGARWFCPGHGRVRELDTPGLHGRFAAAPEHL